MMLTVERIETVPIRVPLPCTFSGSTCRMTHRSTIGTRVHTAEGIVGERYGGDAGALIVRLMQLGRRVGVTSTSHKAIHNLVAEVERAAADAGFAFRGLKKGDSHESACVTTSDNQADFSGLPDDVLLLAGTAWLFSREDMAGVVNTLFVDEAGQVSLADALALGTCARNVVLLGDPQPLGQVSQGIHPKDADASVLKHLLGDEDTVPADRGLFLSLSWRMHPDVCRFISETSYEGRLHSVPACERQRVDSAGLAGTGLRWLPVEHEANRASSLEEADRIAADLELLIGGSFIDRDGRVRPIGWDDVLVVTPYNARCAACEPGSDRMRESAPSTSSRARKPRSSSSRWRPRAATTCRATSSSCSRATASTLRSRVPSRSPCWSQARNCSKSAVTRPSRCAWSTHSAGSWQRPKPSHFLTMVLPPRPPRVSGG